VTVDWVEFGARNRGSIRAHSSISPPNHCMLLSLLRCAACFARLPQTAMMHHRRARLRVWSANSMVQLCPSHALTFEKSSSQTNFAMASPTGSNSASGDRQRRLIRNARAPPSAWPGSIRLNASSRSSRLFNGSSSRNASVVSGHQLRQRQPVDQAMTIIDPVDRRIERRRHRVEEVEAERVGDEHGGRAVHERSLAGREHGLR
jgi:hypothetical protein